MANPKSKTAIILSMVLVLVLVISACSSNTVNKNADEPKKTEPGIAQTSGKLLDAPLTIKVLYGEINTKSPVFDAVFEKTNVRLDFELAPANLDQRLQTIFATNTLPDIMKVANGNQLFASAAKDGLLLNISDYMQYAPNLAKLIKDNPAINNNKVDGKFYSFPQLGNWRLQLAGAPMIRVDLIEKLGMPMPKTFDDLYKVLKKFKEAYPDSIPYTGRENAKKLLNEISFAMGSGNRMYYDPAIKGGSWSYGQAHPEFKPVLEFLNKLYNEKLLDPDYAVNTGDQMKEKLASGKALFYWDNNSFGVNFNQALKAVNPNAKFDLLPPLQYGQAKPRASMYVKDWLHHYVISAKVKDPEKVVKFMDWMYSPEGTRLLNYGIEGVHYTVVNGQPMMKEDIVKKYADTKDPYRFMQKDIAVGFEAFDPNVDEHPMAQVSHPDLIRWASQMTEANGYVQVRSVPPFTKEESEKLKKLTVKVDTLVDQEMDKFIIGVRPLSDYDKFMKSMADNGVAEIEKIYNDAYIRANTP
ncbi:extracellular solute-binding protein [Paenibacillus sp. GCM10023248]|uniref:extracellular solute-binding protein n=1 Tax=Bacillales TaxID=1385 RepID=UPI002378D930|nr:MULTISPECIES: extracellular solute-binding protein [Bacillales]MDD9269573.1 extracellular solute-binding protein [Paenibacillus sp. MAHUQ-63]MDR6880796.1 putative aldouronate transport system substrate-binding protein [Bacillus sp. 3255]